MTDEEATLLEPAACAIHGLDKLNPPVGIEVLLLGAGPTGLMLAQLLKLNGASTVVLAAPGGIKMDIARGLDAADVYVELDRADPGPQWAALKRDWPHGFDVVVEATGVESIANASINYVRRGGTLMIYGVYEDKARVHWPPSKIFGDEIKVGLLPLPRFWSWQRGKIAEAQFRRSSARSRRPTASRARWRISTVGRSRPRAWCVAHASSSSDELPIDMPSLGDGYLPVERLPGRARQDEQPGRVEDCHQAMNGWLGEELRGTRYIEYQIVL